MIRSWIVGCPVIALCSGVGVFAWNLGDLPIGLYTQSDSRNSRGYVRIELPNVEIVRLDQVTDVEAHAMLGASIEQSQTSVFAEPAPSPATAALAGTQGPALTENQAVVIAPTRGPIGLLAVNYDLASENTQARETLDVRKSVRFNGRDAGQATIRVGSGSRLFIDSDDLRTLLAAAERTDLAGELSNGQQSFVGFDEVRERGLNVRYDAVSDRILISG